jgi:hypothetical protein
MFSKLLRSRSSQFRTRSSHRDREGERRRLDEIKRAIRSAIEALETEREGLDRRVKLATDLAAITVGTATEEYIDRDPDRELGLRQFELELRNGNDRLARLDEVLKRLTLLQNEFRGRFPEFYEGGRPTT